MKKIGETPSFTTAGRYHANRTNDVRIVVPGVSSEVNGVAQPMVHLNLRCWNQTIRR